MGKPEDIPQDVLDAALAATDSPFPNDIERIARAILAEREACAQIAEGMRHGHLNLLAQEVTRARADDIAAAIRNREG